MSSRRGIWLNSYDDLLRGLPSTVDESNPLNWNEISQLLPGTNPKLCKQRYEWLRLSQRTTAAAAAAANTAPFTPTAAASAAAAAAAAMNAPPPQPYGTSNPGGYSLTDAQAWTVASYGPAGGDLSLSGRRVVTTARPPSAGTTRRHTAATNSANSNGAVRPSTSGGVRATNPASKPPPPPPAAVHSQPSAPAPSPVPVPAPAPKSAPAPPPLASASRSAVGGDEIVIHVFDDARQVNRDFRCTRAVLARNMKYFDNYLKQSNGTSGESGDQTIDISVHCDVQIFEWLITYIHSPAGSPPPFDVNNLVSILISSDFLGMESLARSAIGYFVRHITAIIALPIDFAGCVSDALLSRVARRLTITQLEALHAHDTRDKLASRCYALKVTRLLSAAANTLFECSDCGDVYSRQSSTRVTCRMGWLTRPHVDAYGAIVARHTPNTAFDVSRFLFRLRAGSGGGGGGGGDASHTVAAPPLSWRSIYWLLWGVCNSFYCNACMRWFAAANYRHCMHHTSQPIYVNATPPPPPAPAGSSAPPLTAPVIAVGRYACCDAPPTQRFHAMLNDGRTAIDWNASAVKIAIAPLPAPTGPAAAAATRTVRRRGMIDGCAVRTHAVAGATAVDTSRSADSSVRLSRVEMLVRFADLISPPPVSPALPVTTTATSAPDADSKSVPAASVPVASTASASSSAVARLSRNLSAAAALALEQTGFRPTNPSLVTGGAAPAYRTAAAAAGAELLDSKSSSSDQPTDALLFGATPRADVASLSLHDTAHASPTAIRTGSTTATAAAVGTANEGSDGDDDDAPAAAAAAAHEKAKRRDKPDSDDDSGGESEDADDTDTRSPHHRSPLVNRRTTADRKSTPVRSNNTAIGSPPRATASGSVTARRAAAWGPQPPAATAAAGRRPTSAAAAAAARPAPPTQYAAYPPQRFDSSDSGLLTASNELSEAAAAAVGSSRRGGKSGALSADRLRDDDRNRLTDMMHRLSLLRHS